MSGRSSITNHFEYTKTSPLEAEIDRHIPKNPMGTPGLFLHAQTTSYKPLGYRENSVMAGLDYTSGNKKFNIGAGAGVGWSNFNSKPSPVAGFKATWNF